MTAPHAQNNVPASAKLDIGEVGATCRRATGWVVRHLRDDGSLGDPADGFKYHRAPWAFALMGEVEAAHATCGWIRGNLLTPGGKLEGPLRKLNDGWAYLDSVLIVGAQMIQQHDLATGLMPALLTWQDEVSGRFANDRLPKGGMSDEMDIPYACGPGFACLMTGLPYQLTGDPQHRDWLARMASWYLSREEAEGYWHPWVEECLGDVIETTLEFVVHIMTIVGAVTSRSPSGEVS